MSVRNIRILCLSLLPMLAFGIDNVEFFISPDYGICEYKGQSIETGGIDLCGWDSTVSRLYNCRTPGTTCWTWYQTCKEGSTAGTGQIGCGVGKTWCCSDAEACPTAQNKINICVTKWSSPNITAQEAAQALGVSSVASTLTSGQVIGSFSASLFGSTTVNTAISSLPPTSSAALSSTTSTSSSTPTTISTSAIAVASSSATQKPSAPASPSSSLGGGSIAGIVVGVLAAVALGAGAMWFVLKRKTRNQSRDQGQNFGHMSEPTMDATHDVNQVHEAPNSVLYEVSGWASPTELPEKESPRHEIG